jgi:hypothetical protein
MIGSLFDPTEARLHNSVTIALSPDPPGSKLLPGSAFPGSTKDVVQKQDFVTVWVISRFTDSEHLSRLALQAGTEHVVSTCGSFDANQADFHDPVTLMTL